MTLQLTRHQLADEAAADRQRKLNPPKLRKRSPDGPRSSRRARSRFWGRARASTPGSSATTGRTSRAGHANRPDARSRRRSTLRCNWHSDCPKHLDSPLLDVPMLAYMRADRSCMSTCRRRLGRRWWIGYSVVCRACCPTTYASRKWPWHIPLLTPGSRRFLVGTRSELATKQVVSIHCDGVTSSGIRAHWTLRP